MKFFIIFCALFILSLSSAMANVKIIPKVIYGNDDRLDVFESSDSLMRELSRSSSALIPNEKLIASGDSFTIKAETLHESGMCTSERFANQLIAADCSGFLVSPDTLVTAGHCIRTLDDCQKNSWVFDYTNSNEVKKAFIMNKNQVFHCTKIVERAQDKVSLVDFAVVKLDRAVVGRTPFSIRTSGKVADDAVLTIIGNPTGLPTKITSAADIRDNKNAVYIRVNSDTYSGNSGSAVVDSRTGIIEGILVRGDTDYTQSGKCLVSVVRDQNGGRGEDVTRITVIKSLSKK